MEWGGGGGGVLPARWCEESGDSEEVYEEGEGMGDQGDHDQDDAESCTGGDEEEEEEMMGNGKERRSTTVLVDNGWRTWFPHERCTTSSICDEEEENGEQCVRSVVCVVDEEEHSVHQIQDNRLFWETCLAVGY